MGHDRRLLRQGAGEVQRGPDGAGHHCPVDLDDLVVAEPGDMTAEQPSGVVPRSGAAGDVHPVQRYVPQRQPEQDRG
jgi:hypothetical protein